VAVDDQTIRDFVAANISNPQAIADAAQANGVTADQIATAMNTSVDSVQNYFVSAGVKPLSYVNKSTGHVMQPTGNVTPEGTPEYLDVTGTEINKAGGGGGSPFNIGNLVKVGLAYALPIVGEAIAAELAVSTSVGTALAAVGTGVAQGQDIGTAIKSAAPALIASNVMSEVDLNKLTDNITKDPKLQNVINNVANSTIKTAIGGGDVKDIVTNAVATGGGTLIGQATGSQTLGQGLATAAATGDIVKGAQAAAGSAGQEEATRNLVERQVAPIMNAPASAIDPQTQAIINQLGLNPQDPGVMTAANAPPNMTMVAASALPAMLGTGNEKAGPIQSNVDAEGNVTYSRAITGVDANGKEYQYVATYDPLETTPNRQVSYSIPGTIGTAETAAPSVAGTSTSYTRPSFDVTTEGEGISTKTTPDITISTAGIGSKGGVEGGAGPGTGDTAKVGPTDAGGTKGGTAAVAGPGGGAGGPGDNLGPGGTGLGGPGTGPGAGAGDGVGVGKGGAGAGAGTGDTGDTGDVGGGALTVDTPVSKPETKTPDTTTKTTPEVTDSTDVSITTSAVKPQIKAAYPTITGQFASPLTQAISAYRPAGELESQATGKEREDVWNTESLRNALGI